MATDSTGTVPLSTQCLRRACEVERQQRAEAIARLESNASDDLTDAQRAIVADLARSLTAALTPVAIQALHIADSCTQDAEDHRDAASSPDDR